MQDYKVLSKGKYSAAADTPVRITQWLLVEKDGKKYLLLKLSKNGEKNISRVRVKIDMLDKRGKYLGTASAESENIPDKDEFVFDGQIEVKDGFSSFKAQIQAEDESGYIYSQTDNGVAVDFADARQNGADIEKLKSGMGGKSVVVSERGFKAPVLICIFACVLFICAILFTCLQLASFKKSQYDFLRSGVEYTFVNGDKSDTSALYVTGYRGNSPDVVIPERIEEHLVVEISESAFSGNRKIKSLVVEGETQIRLRAFYFCPNLKSIEANAVTQIDNEAFFGCDKLENISVNSVVSVGRRAFYGCGLTELKIPESENVIYLNDYAFANCEGLKEISIGREISYRGTCLAFSGAKSLKSLSLVNLPNNSNFSSILDRECTSLETVRIKNLFSVGDNFCVNFKNVKSFTVENLESKRVGSYAFHNCTALEEVNLPEGITHVGENAFYGTAITSFNGNSLESIGGNAFSNCGNLKTFRLEGNTALKSIGGSAFYGCESLQKIAIPADITELPSGVFSGCKSLEKITFFADDILTDIGNSAFYGCSSLEEINIPATVRELGYSAFMGCSALSAANLPERITEIGSYTFADCTSLEYVYIPEAVTMINPYAFSGCTSLKTFAVGGSISSFGTCMLQGCNSLKEISLPLNIKLSYLFGGAVPDSLRKVEVTRVSSLPQEAFRGCKNIRTVILNENLSYVGRDAFTGCYRLYEIFNLGGANVSCAYALEIHNSLSEEMPKVSDGGYVAAYSARLDKWYLIDYPEDGNEFDLPSRLIYNGAAIDYCLADYLFYGTDVASVKIPVAVTGIGASAFENCIKLKEISVPSDEAVSVGTRAFFNCVSLEKVEILSAASIGASAFESCVNLVGADIPYGSGLLGERAFYGCSALESFSIPSGVVAVGQSAFRDCVNLKKVTLPDSLRGIYSEAFLNCERLRAVVNYSSLTISAGSVNNGGVAQYAVAVATTAADAAQLEYVDYGGVTYLRFKTRWYAVWGDKSVASIKIEAFTYNGNRADDIVICPYAFSTQSDLISVVMGPAVKEIGACAFSNCFNLRELKLPSSGLTQIGERAFSACMYISEVNIPYGVTQIPDGAFLNCSYLKWVTLPEGLRTIGGYAFSGCSQLKEINLPASITSIGDSAFFGCYVLEEITFPTNLNYLGASAFQSCSRLKEVRLPERLTYISDYAFAYCSRLSDVVLPASLTAIGNNAFLGCAVLYQVHNLSQLNIRAGADSYGRVAYYAFKVFNNDKQSLTFAEDSSCKFVYVDGTWYLYSYIGSYYRTAILPETFTVNGNTVASYGIRGGVFSGNRSVMIPASVNSIEYGAIASDAVIYYGGAQSKWLAIRPQSLINAKVYFYTDEIENDNQWTYDRDGNIITREGAGV
ncbi:MAG: leucine-rich repeat domain-containing protein [Clostridia bacterium]|nr:leucine-rich repeat domain-containing protein [Clostridia bacterium]